MLHAAADLVADDEGGEYNSPAGDQHLADHATDLVDRELDHSLGENAENVVAEIDAAIARIDDGTYGTCAKCGIGDTGGEARRHSVRGSLPRRQAVAGARVSEPARSAPPRRVDVRIGSSTNALQPISGAERRLGAGRAQWVALVVIAGTAIARRPADEGDRRRAAAARRHGGHDRAVQHPSRSEHAESRSASSPTRPRR